jgi:hypothetical protein
MSSIRRLSATYGLTATSVAAIGAMIFACSEVLPPDEAGTFFGPVVTVGAGTGRAYVTLDRTGVPTDLGVSFTEAVLTGLPAASTEFVFVLPPQASVTPFKHLVLNWWPMGHPPPMIYTVPHFDAHFYMITLAERLAIVPEKLALRPAQEFVPEGYVAGMSIPQMGMHWNDPEAPEHKGEPFTKTFFFGSYDGAFIFAEPMVTIAYLETKPAVVTPLKLPGKYATRGYQPTSYTLAHDAGTQEYRIALSGFVSR